MSEEKKNDFTLEVPAPKTITSVRPSNPVHMLNSGTSMGVEPIPRREFLPGVRSMQLSLTEIHVHWDNIAKACGLPKHILTGGRSMATLAALPGVEYVKGVFITRWPAGRLFWPVEVVGRANVAEMENVITWTAGLSDISTHVGMHPTFDLGSFRIGFCRFKDVEEPWKLWEVDVGDVDPEEWVVTFVSFD
jgi:hypothetical protein